MGIWRVLAIIKDEMGKTIGAEIALNEGNTARMATERLQKLAISQGSQVFENAILGKNGYLRAKAGCSLPVKELSQKKSKCITVYHGSPAQYFTPTYGFGEDKHDYGRGFYTTPFPELGREWAVCLNRAGWLHTYKLNLDDLRVFDFDKVSPLCWLAELMKHRAADSSVRYKKLAPDFIKKFQIDISDYDVVVGWRADSSYFSIAKHFVRNEVNYELLGELLRLGDLNKQVCIKSEKAYARLNECAPPEAVSVDKYLPLYQARDAKARLDMNTLLQDQRNTMKHGIDFVMEEGFTNAM